MALSEEYIQQALDRYEREYGQEGESRYELDDDSSDLLLLQVLDDKSEEIVAMHPVGRGLGGPNRVAWIAKRYIAYLQSRVASA